MYVVMVGLRRRSFSARALRRSAVLPPMLAERFLRAWRFDRRLYAEVIEATGWLSEGTTMAGSEIPEAELAGMKRDFGKYGEMLWTGHRSLRALVQEIDKRHKQLALLVLELD